MPILARAQVSCKTDIVGKSDSELQTILDQCEREIAEQKTILQATQATASVIERGIAELNYKIKTSELEIRARAIQVKQLGEGIVAKNEKIEELEGRLDKIGDSLAELLRKANEFNNLSPVEALLSEKDLSEFFADADHYDTIKIKLNELLAQIRGVRTETETERKELEDRRTKEQALKSAQENLKHQNENYRVEKQRILQVTRGQEALYKKEIADRERIKNEIRNRLFRTVGGTELTFGEAVKLVAPYENIIGTPAALTLAVLSQESSADGLIGKNIGKCYYNQTASNSSGTVMADSQKPSFLAITGELGLNPDTTPVSCPIYSDGNYGGAMGSAQFMPKTWWDIASGFGYKQRVAKVLNVPTPSPFVNLHAFTGTAVYLSDAMGRCRSAFSAQFDIWSCTAAKYYAGLTVSGSRLARYMRSGSYGYQVATRAQQYQRDIDLLDL